MTKAEYDKERYKKIWKEKSEYNREYYLRTRHKRIKSDMYKRVRTVLSVRKNLKKQFDRISDIEDVRRILVATIDDWCYENGYTEFWATKLAEGIAEDLKLQEVASDTNYYSD